VRRRLLRWGSWFAVANAVLLGLIGLRYLWTYAEPVLSVAWLYVVVAYIGHWATFAYLPFLLVLLPVTLLLPRPRLVLPLGVLLGAVGLSVVLLDSLVFGENHYHLTPLTVALLAPQTWGFTALYLLLFLAIDAMIAQWIWRRSAQAPRRRMGRYVAIGLVGCVLASHLVYVWAEATYYVPVTSFTYYLPLYLRLSASGPLARAGLVNRERALAQGFSERAGRTPAGVLDYPLAPLRCSPPAAPLNVVLILVDAMRADALTPAVAPNISDFAEHGIRFDRHYSGGNSSRAGMFSLFYGLPAPYWDAFAGVARPPVLIDLFQQSGYQLGLFASAAMNRAVGLEKTAFARVPNLRLGTTAKTSHEKDRIITVEWFDWLDHRDPSRPFLGMVYYDAAQARNPPESFESRFPPPKDATKMQREHARYLAAVNYVDTLAGRVLADLERRELLDRTLVIVTSDHGMEFDENGQGFAGHGTSYSDYQLRTPLVMRWPGRPAQRITHRTSHHDLAPTLVSRLFGCTNPPADYSSGHDLFSGTAWTWLIAGSYVDFALVEPDRVTVSYQSGYYEIRDRGYRLVSGPPVAGAVLQAAMHEMSRFYR